MARRSTRIYRTWVINGVAHDLSSVPEFVRGVALAITSLGLVDRRQFLVFSVPPEDSAREATEAREASLELLDVEEVASRVGARVCCLHRLPATDAREDLAGG